MEHNVGVIDKIARILIGLGALYTSYYYYGVSTAWTLVFGIVALAMLATAIIGYCSVYKLAGWNTCSVEKQDATSAPAQKPAKTTPLSPSEQKK